MMNAPFLPQKPERFPKLSPAQKILQAAADRAIMREIVKEMDIKPGITGGPSHSSDYPCTAWEARNVLR